MVIAIKRKSTQPMKRYPLPSLSLLMMHEDAGIDDDIETMSFHCHVTLEP